MIYTIKAKHKKRKIDNILDSCYNAIVDECDVHTSPMDIMAKIYRFYLDNGIRLPNRMQMETMVSTYHGRFNDVAHDDEKKSDMDMIIMLYCSK